MKLVEELEAIKQADPVMAARNILSAETDHDVTMLKEWGFKGVAENLDNMEATRKISARLATDRLYTLAQVERLCRKFDLFFRPVEQFRGKLDSHVINDLRAFKEKNKKVVPLYVVAPQNQFVPDPVPVDPLLLADCGGGIYALISQWGGDLRWLRYFRHSILPWVLLGIHILAISALALLIAPWLFIILITVPMAIGMYMEARSDKNKIRMKPGRSDSLWRS